MEVIYLNFKPILWPFPYFRTPWNLFWCILGQNVIKQTPQTTNPLLWGVHTDPEQGAQGPKLTNDDE